MKVERDNEGFYIDNGCEYATVYLRYTNKINLDTYASCRETCPFYECLECLKDRCSRWSYIAKLLGVSKYEIKQWYEYTEKRSRVSKVRYYQLGMPLFNIR